MVIHEKETTSSTEPGQREPQQTLAQRAGARRRSRRLTSAGSDEVGFAAS